MANAGDRRESMGDRQGQRQDSRQDRLNDRQDYRDFARDDWQNWHDNRYPYHGNWYHGFWGGGYMHPGGRLEYWWDNYPVMTAFGLTSWAINRVGYAFGWYNYSNPYYGSAGYVDSGAYNYSEPIVVESAPVYMDSAPVGSATAEAPAEPADATPPGVSPEALAQFDAARQEFYSGNYDAALTSVDAAIREMPSDAVLHEFRALTLFALGKYQEAAATLYAVLSAGPGWDWTTMIGLYPDVDTYTKHLRALEAYRDSHPEDAAARLLLAYHYLTGGHADAAKEQLQKLLTLTPTDPLARNMLAELDPTAVPEEAPPTVEPPAAANAVQAEAVAGTWKATRPGGDSFTMELKADGAFTWSFTQGGQTQSVSGVYAIDEQSVIAMEMEDGGVMLAQLDLQGDKLDFMMLGDDRNSPPLQFARQP